MRWLVTLIMTLLPAVAGAQTIVTETVSRYSRVLNPTTATSTSGCTVGVHGCLASESFASVTSVSISGPGASLAPMPHPARVRVSLFDSGANGTLACTAQTIRGYHPDGRIITESMGALSESMDLTANVFASIISYSATGCSGGATSDVLRLDVEELEIGLPVRISSVSDVSVSIAAANGTGSNFHPILPSSLTLVGNGYGVSFSGSTVYGSTGGGITPLDGMQLRIEARGGRLIQYAGGAR